MPRQREPSSPPPSEPALRRCVYCMPAEPGKPRASADECLIKRLGPRECRQVNEVLKKVVSGEPAPPSACPMSADGSYERCPFYEDD